MNRLSRSTLWRLFAYFKPKRFQYVLSMLVVAGLFASERLFTGWIVLLFTDAIANQDMLLLRNAVLYWALFSLGLMLVSPVFLYLWRASIVQGVASLRQAVFSHLQRLPLAYFESRHTGEAMSFLTNDVSASEQAFTRDILDLVQSTLQAVGAVVFMLFLKWDLAVIIIIGGMVPLVVNVISARRLRLIGQETQGRLADVSERLSDLLAGFQVIRTFNLGDWILERFTRSNQEVFAVSMRRVRIESALASANDIGAIAVLLSYTVGAYMVLDGQTSLGVLFGLIQLNNPVQTFFYRAGEIVSRIQASLAAGDRLLAVLGEAPEPERYLQPVSLAEPAGAPHPLSADARLPASPAQVSPQPVELSSEFESGSQKPESLTRRKVLELQDVHFAYGDNAPILSGLCLEVQEGQTVALVGPSGSGKSTIFRLLMGHFLVKDGRLDVFEQPAYALSLQELRLLFAYVPQDAYLFSGSVLENIRYGRLEAGEDAVIAAAQASYAHDFIIELPQGYQTQVGERGARLSGGQRQRIAIARALIKDAPVLLLDEATSALDSESEELVQKALDRLMQGRTTIAIAHRLSTIEHADLIYVLENGRVVEQGKHAGLLDAGGLYSYLYNLQFRDEAGNPVKE